MRPAGIFPGCFNGSNECSIAMTLSFHLTVFFFGNTEAFDAVPKHMWLIEVFMLKLVEMPCSKDVQSCNAGCEACSIKLDDVLQLFEKMKHAAHYNNCAKKLVHAAN